MSGRAAVRWRCTMRPPEAVSTACDCWWKPRPMSGECESSILLYFVVVIKSKLSLECPPPRSLSISQSINLSIHQSIYSSIYLSVYLGRCNCRRHSSVYGLGARSHPIAPFHCAEGIRRRGGTLTSAAVHQSNYVGRRTSRCRATNERPNRAI